MAREYAKINVGIWADDDFLDFDVHAQLLYFVLLTDPSLSYCGVSDWRPKRIRARTAGWDSQTFETALAQLTAHRLVIVDEDTEEYLIRGFLRHDGVLNHNRTRVSALNATTAVASKVIRGVIVHELLRLRNERPENTVWELKGAQDVLKRRAIDPFGPDFGPAFGNGLGRDLGTIRPGVRDGLGPNSDKDLGLHQENLNINISSNEDISLAQSHSKALEPATAPIPSSKDLESEFKETFWPAYPKKVDRSKAMKAFLRARKDCTLEEIMSGLSRYCAQGFEDQRFIAHATTWLNGRRWEDEVTSNALSTRPISGSSREMNARSTYDHIADMAWPFEEAS